MLPRCYQWTQALVTREPPLPLVSAVKGQVMILPRQCRKKHPSNQASLCCLWQLFVLGSSCPRHTQTPHTNTLHICTHATQTHVTHTETPTPYHTPHLPPAPYGRLQSSRKFFMVCWFSVASIYFPGFILTQ